MSKVLILIGGRHFNDPLHAFSNLYFNRWISLSERGCHFGNPLSASLTQLFNL